MAMSEESTSQAAPGDVAEYAEHRGIPGVRFVPKDNELIVHYLRRKLRGEPLPTDQVLEGSDAYAEHPEKLVPKLGAAIGGAWYLFSPRYRKHPGGMLPERGTGDGEGHWRSAGNEKHIFGGADGKEVIGTKRELTFHQDSHKVNARGKRKRVQSNPTVWRMVEFVSSNSSRALGDETTPDPILLDACVLCKITRDRGLRQTAVERGPAQGEGEENDDDNGEEEPTSDGDGEPQKKHLFPEQQPAGGGGAGTQGKQQQASGGGPGAQGEQQLATAEAPSGGHMAALPNEDNRGAPYSVDVGGSNWSGNDMRGIFDSDDHIGTAYGGGESVDAQRAGHQQAASGGGARSSPGEQRFWQPPPEAPNGGGAAPAATAAASRLSVPYRNDWELFDYFGFSP